MKTIWKFPLLSKHTATFDVLVPPKAFPLHIAQDPAGNLSLWCAVNSSKALVPAVVTIVGTGNELPDNAGAFVNTFFIGSFVFHGFYREVE